MVKKYLIILMALLWLSSCEKSAGEGGTSSITGKVYIEKYNADQSFLIKEYYAQEEDVYVIYGDDEVYSERFRTHYDGSFIFKNLRPGSYKVFAYSDDIYESSGKKPIIKEVEITENNQIVDVGDIIIKK